MPRQRYLKVVSNPQRKALLDFNLNTTSDRSELHALVGDCLLAWPYVEAEMAVVLAELLRAENEPAVAVFQTIRRSSAQRDCISVATLASHDQQATELVGAILNITKSVEASRNALAHGHFGMICIRHSQPWQRRGSCRRRAPRPTFRCRVHDTRDESARI
jgi:hypothetical protein